MKPWHTGAQSRAAALTAPPGSATAPPERLRIGWLLSKAERIAAGSIGIGALVLALKATAWWLTGGYHLLTVLFASFTVLYGYAALR